MDQKGISKEPGVVTDQGTSSNAMASQNESKIKDDVEVPSGHTSETENQPLSDEESKCSLFILSSF